MMMMMNYFPTSNMIMRTRLNVTLCLHSLPCLCYLRVSQLFYQQALTEPYSQQHEPSPHFPIFSKPCTKLTLHCNHRSGHIKTEHTESLFLLRRHRGNWPHGPAVSMRSELLVAHEKLGQLPLLMVFVVPV